MANSRNFTERELDRIIEMAWEDRTPFEAILFQFDLPEKEVIKLMRGNLKESSFKRWRKRVTVVLAKSISKSVIQILIVLNAHVKNRFLEIKSVNDNVIFPYFLR